jgi:hypothetical protein
MAASSGGVFSGSTYERNQCLVGALVIAALVGGGFLFQPVKAPATQASPH